MRRPLPMIAAWLLGVASVAGCSGNAPEPGVDTGAGSADRVDEPATGQRPPALDAASSAPPTASADVPAAPTTASAPRTRLWQCDSTRVQVRQDARRAVLNFNGRKLELARVASTDGDHFADSDGNALHDQGAQATLTLAGKTPLRCEPSDVLSPWVQAEQDGAVFRASGNEPGWIITVDSQVPPRLHAQLDYGERNFTIATTGSSGVWRGQAPDGSTLQMRASRSACQDDMSGASFEATVTVQVGDKQYRGCGAWLTD